MLRFKQSVNGPNSTRSRTPSTRQRQLSSTTGARTLAGHRLAAKDRSMTRMYGRAVRRKRFRRSGGFAVLHQCISLRLERVSLRAIMDISADASSLSDGLKRDQGSHAPGSYAPC